MLLGAAVIFLAGESGMPFIILILGLSFLIAGISTIIRYFTMAKHMVGGRLILYYGVIMLDLGIFTTSLTSASKYYIAIYLVGIYLFSGVIHILRGVESRKLEARQWKTTAAEGIVRTVLGLACLFFINSAYILVVIYAAGLFYSAVTRIASAFRKTAVVYIQ